MTQRVRLTDKTASAILAEKVAQEVESFEGTNVEAGQELEKKSLPNSITDEASCDKAASMEGDKELLPKSEGADYSIQDPDKDLVDNSPIGKDDEKSREEQQGKVAAIKVAHAKAVKCLTAADRMFPTAAEDVIVKTAVSLMKHMPMGEIDALMERQAEYAAALAKQAEEMVPAEEEKVVEAAAPAEEEKVVEAAETGAEETKEAGEETPAKDETVVEAAEDGAAKDNDGEDWKAKYAALEQELQSLKAAADKTEGKDEEVTFDDTVKTAAAKGNTVDEIFQSVIPGFQPKISSLSKTAGSKEESIDDKIARLFKA